MATLFLTNNCKNKCVICCTVSKVFPKIYPIGKTEVKKKALKNLLRDQDMCLTGGDVLLNRSALETIAELSEEDGIKRRVVLNPISFTKMDKEEKEFNLELLRNFTVYWSYGDVRGSYPGENEEARISLEESLKRHSIVSGNQFKIDSYLEKIDGKLHIKGKGGFSFVGKSRLMHKRGKLEVKPTYPNKIDCNSCEYLDPSISYFEKRNGNIELVFSSEQFDELSRVLDYPKFNFTEEQKRRFKNLVLEIAIFVQSEEKIEVIKDDPDDNIILEGALAGEVDYIITGDTHLLNLKEFRGIKIITAKEFVGLLEKV